MLEAFIGASNYSSVLIGGWIEACYEIILESFGVVLITFFLSSSFGTESSIVGVLCNSLIVIFLD